ncbi:MAG: ATP-binding protein [Lachnospiraceae bacterium]|nr:ATP-binding protein [Lachnospiraceae bacterium]
MKKKTICGTDDYRKLIESNGYYVDKTLLIQELLESGSEITLITRPRRFGKTLNMTMLRDFFDINQDSKAIFEGTNIMKTEYADKINSVPIIYLTFKDCNGVNADSLIVALKNQLRYEYLRQLKNIHDKSKISEELYRIFLQYKEILIDARIDIEYVKNILPDTIKLLANILNEYYGIKPIIIIDEYDNPFIEAKTNGYYDDVRGILADIFGNTFKGNSYIEKGVMTGIQRIAQESIFSKFNNPSVCTVVDEEYADKFGLTEEETKEYLNYFDMEYNKKVKQYYDGYNFSGFDVYNPMSITSLIKKKGKLDSYWVNTSSNTLIKEEIPKADKDFIKKFEKLIEEGSCIVSIDLRITFQEKQTSSTLWGLLLNAGYITVQKNLGDGDYRIRIPNEEVKKEFKSIVAEYTRIGESTLKDLFRALQDKDMKEFMNVYEDIIFNCTSCFDDRDMENSYHMLMLGMSIFLEPDFRVESNRERGKERSDISIYAKNDRDINVIIEYKFEKTDNYNILENKAKEALQQIHDNKYYSSMNGEVLLIGIAHSIKDFAMEHEIIETKSRL